MSWKCNFKYHGPIVYQFPWRRSSNHLDWPFRLTIKKIRKSNSSKKNNRTISRLSIRMYIVHVLYIKTTVHFRNAWNSFCTTLAATIWCFIIAFCGKNDLRHSAPLRVIWRIVYQFINPHKLVMFKQECLYGLKGLYISSACIYLYGGSLRKR